MKSLRTVSIQRMFVKRVFVAIGLVVLAACGDVEVMSEPNDDVVVTTTVEVVAPSEPAPAEPAPTTTIETTTTAPVTTTTVLDVICIKTTACQYAKLVGVYFSRLKLDFINF